MSSPPARSSWLGRLASIVGVLLVLSGATIAFVVADARAGRASAVAALGGFFVVPLAFALLVRRIASGIDARPRVLRVAAYGTFGLGGAVVIAAWRLFPAETRSAFTRAFAGEPALDGGASSAASASRSTAPSGATEAAPPATPDDVKDFSAGSASYTEPDCALADVTALDTGYVPGGTRASAEALAQARYPIGLPFLQAQDDAQLRAWYTGAPDSFAGVASRFDVAVHEGSHVWIGKRFDPATYTYPVRTDLTIVTRRLKNFDRSAIVPRLVDAANDPYAKIYLSGASGAQGFNTLLDEYNAYTHSLASRYCTRDLSARGTRVSARDGILTMMYYVETYLALARDEHPADYAAILADPGHRRLLLTVWDRAELWLRRSADSPALGISDRKIKEWVYDPARLAELTRVREADGARDR